MNYPLLNGILIIKSEAVNEPMLFLPVDMYDDFLKEFPIQENKAGQMADESAYKKEEDNDQ